jgi:hypothetical protein
MAANVHGARRRPVLAAGLALTATLLPAAMSSADDGRSAFFRSIDGNGDGRVDMAEFQAYMIRGFDRLDGNGNGVLDIAEQPPGARRRPVTRSEQLRAYAEAFVRQDSNGDGVLDLAELSAPPR